MGVALIEIELASVHRFVPAGLVEPPLGGVTVNDRRYWVFQVAVAVLGLFIVMEFEGEETPEASPLHPVKTYWVPMAPATVNGDTDADAEAPASYQPPPSATL